MNGRGQEQASIAARHAYLATSWPFSPLWPLSQLLPPLARAVIFVPGHAQQVAGGQALDTRTLNLATPLSPGRAGGKTGYFVTRRLPDCGEFMATFKAWKRGTRFSGSPPYPASPDTVER